MMSDAVKLIKNIGDHISEVQHEDTKDINKSASHSQSKEENNVSDIICFGV